MCHIQPTKEQYEHRVQSRLETKDLFMWVYVLTVYFSLFSFLSVWWYYYYSLFCFPPKRQKKNSKSNLFTFVSRVCVFLQEMCSISVCVFSKKTKRRKNKGDGIIPCVLLLSNYLSTFSFCFFLWVDAVCVCVFFLCRRLFPYLFIKRLCACVSFYYLLCVFAYSSFILFCFRLLNSP